MQRRVRRRAVESERRLAVSDFRDFFGGMGPEDDRRPSSDDAGLEPENRGYRSLNEKEVRVVNVYEGIYDTPGGQGSSTTFVLLRDNRGREFKIFVLRDVALAISLGLENDPPDRPHTHDLMKTFIDRLGAKVERVTIDDLWNDTFYAKIGLTQNGESIEIDARPSDAIAIALRARAPIYVAEAVLEASQPE